MTQTPSPRPARVPGQESGNVVDFTDTRRTMQELTRACAEAMEKSTKHFQGADAWMIGAMPGATAIADRLESQLRAFLANSQLTSSQVDDVAAMLKATGDLRGVARCARQGAQLSWLIRQEQSAADSFKIVLSVAEPSQRLALLALEAVAKSDSVLARNAALQYREVAERCAEAEASLRGHVLRTQMPPTVRRMTRAGIWFMALSGEGMARVAARLA